MRILVTGGAGFIGSHLCDFLLGKGEEVICFDNLVTGREENIRHNYSNEKFSFIKGNVSEYINVEGPIDFILHFASPASPVDYLNLPIQTLKAGSLGTLNTLGLAKAKKAKYLLASTSEIYGDPLVSPQPEEYWGNVNSIGPRGVYDEAKRFAEAVTMAYHRTHGVDTRIVRIFNTYGPRMRGRDGRIVPNFIMQAIDNKPLTVYGDGSQTRSFCYVSDLVEGIYKLMLSDLHGPINLGNPEEIRVIDFAKKVGQLSGKNVAIKFEPLPEDDPKQRKPEIKKARENLGWEPKVKLEEGLAKTMAWFETEMKK